VGAEACREAEEESNARQGVRTSKKKEVARSLTRAQYRWRSAGDSGGRRDSACFDSRCESRGVSRTLCLT
jgi:hypothetical protein